MKKVTTLIVGIMIFSSAYSQGSFATAEYMAPGVSYSGTVTDNNNGPVNIPFHYYKTSLAGNGMIRILSTITNPSLSSGGDVLIKIYFKDQVLWDTKQVYVPANTTKTDTFMVTGVEMDSIYILFQNYGVVYGGPYSYSTHYDLLNVESNTEMHPNDYHTQAQTLMPGDSVMGHISFRGTNYYRDYNDYYKLVLSDNGTADLYCRFTNLRIASTFTIPGANIIASGKDSNIAVTMAHSSSANSSNLFIASNTNTPLAIPVFDTMHIYGRANDTVYIHVYNYFTGWDIGYAGAYRITYKMSDIAPSNEVNPNDDRVNAQFINNTSNIQGVIGYYDGNNNVDQNDYYKVATTVGDSVKIYITATNKFKYYSTSPNPNVWAYDKNGNALMVYSATGASFAGGQLIRNVWLQPIDVPITDTMTIRNVPTDSIYLRVYNYDASFQYQLSLTPTPTTSVQGLEVLDDEIIFYPNPVSDQLNIQLNVSKDENIELNLYSMTGAKIKNLLYGKAHAQQQLKIDVSELTAGMYFLQLRTESGYSTTKKLIIE
ncbi:MAG TPA: T9SS type A sorting domain-containing protein [Flavipsychrobacter sp.]|nr:T9SS type A sorting domain-containing protein [Flavipsychrobacter sp.]